ncbi:hypothetical protein, partial [Escherichia coli]|uniref:hypothetical protein n=1 Tax=Escherichia coli TaxID=562 RepID=UPI001E59B72E
YEDIHLSTLAFISGNTRTTGSKHHPVCIWTPVYSILIWLPGNYYGPYSTYGAFFRPLLAAISLLSILLPP